MSTPKRIKRERTKGWRMPDGAVYVGRPTYWGNPFKLGESSGAAYGNVDVVHRGLAVRLFREYLAKNPIIAKDAATCLRGRDLACWCPLGEPCHAEVLLELANSAD